MGSEMKIQVQVRYTLYKCIGNKTFSGEMYYTLLTPDRESMIDQSMNTTEVQLGEPMSSTGATFRNMGKALLRGAEMMIGTSA